MTLRTPWRNRRIVVGSLIALVVLVVVGLVIGTRGDDAATPTATPSPTSSPTPGTPAPTADPTSGTAAPTDPGTAPAPQPAPAPPTPVDAAPVAVDEPPASLPAVGFDSTVQDGGGVTAGVTELRAIDGEAVGPGNIAGPALLVTVRVVNGSGAPLALDGISVTASHGADGVPSSPLDDPRQAPFSGSLEPGGEADGVYAFSVPTGQREQVTVTVGTRAGAPLLVFTGSAS